MTLPKGFDKTLAELAKTGFDAYGDEAGWKAYDGKPMPRWDELPEHIRTKWTVAAGAIAKALTQSA